MARRRRRGGRLGDHVRARLILLRELPGLSSILRLLLPGWRRNRPCAHPRSDDQRATESASDGRAELGAQRRSNAVSEPGAIVTPKLDSEPITKCCTIALAKSNAYSIADSVAHDGAERGAVVCSDAAAISCAHVATDPGSEPCV